MPARSAASAHEWSKTNSPMLWPLRYSGQAATRRSSSYTARCWDCQPVFGVTQRASSILDSQPHSRNGEPLPTKASQSAWFTSCILWITLTCSIVAGIVYKTLQAGQFYLLCRLEPLLSTVNATAWPWASLIKNPRPRQRAKHKSKFSAKMGKNQSLSPIAFSLIVAIRCRLPSRWKS